MSQKWVWIKNEEILSPESYAYQSIWAYCTWWQQPFNYPCIACQAKCYGHRTGLTHPSSTSKKIILTIAEMNPFHCRGASPFSWSGSRWRTDLWGDRSTLKPSPSPQSTKNVTYIPKSSLRDLILLLADLVPRMEKNSHEFGSTPAKTSLKFDEGTADKSDRQTKPTQKI